MTHAPPPPPRPGADWVESRDWAARAGQGPAVPRSRTSWAPPPRGGLVPLRPLRFFEVLDGGFRVMRHNAKLTIGVPVLLYVLWNLLAGAALAGVFLLLSDAPTLESTDSAGLGLTFFSNVAATVASFGSLPLIQIIAALITVSAEAERRGERLSPLGAWRRLRPMGFRLVALLLLLTAIQLGTLVVLMLPGIGLFFVNDVIGFLLVGLAGLLWVVPVLFIAVRFFQAAPAMVTEDLGVFASLRRSWVLTRGSFWRVTGLDVTAYVLGSTLASIILTPLLIIIMIVLVIVTFAATDLDATVTLAAFLSIGVGVLLSTVVTGMVYSYFGSIVSLVYLDTRMRAEGYDLQLLREAEDRQYARERPWTGAGVMA